MNANSHCLDHSGTCANIENVESLISAEKLDREKGETVIWSAIDGMRRMYFLSMTSFLGLCISGIAFLFAKMMHWL